MKITNKRYSELIEAEMTLNSLYAAGVDNWEGWDIAMESLEEIKQTNKKLDIEEG
ncbi:MAG: hypothetical protein JRJ85_08095 [Deltaproteobacteria bacterium]|nr:hypothetical protein [Deltaproteobacteria bacterium]